MGYPKYTRLALPLRPIVSSRGSITYEVSKELVNIIWPLVGQSPHHLKNMQQFVEQIKKVKLKPGEVMASYNVKALFTSVPMDLSITIFQCKLQQDPLLSQRTCMSISQIVSLLEFCHKKTHNSSSRVRIMNRSMVQPWVSPLAPLSPTSSWKSSKLRPSLLPHSLNLWLRYISDTFVIQQAKHSHQLIQHLNPQDPHIQFTTEDPNGDDAFPFLDTLVSPGPINTLTTTVYRKPTHTDQYLHWDSNHFTSANNSIFNTLA